MPTTMVVTRNVEDRYRGFLTSIMLEIAPGVYVAPDLSAAVRTRLWYVLSSWWDTFGTGSVTMVWRDTQAVGNLPFPEPRRTLERNRGCRRNFARKTQITPLNSTTTPFHLHR